MNGPHAETAKAAPVRAHRIAAAAYRVVERRGADSDPNRKAYGALAHKLPGLILQNGLAQATGFLLAKGKPEHLALLEDLRYVLQAAGAVGADTAHGPALHQRIIEADLSRTLTLTRSALESAGWIKRYVQGILRIDPTGDPTETEDPDHAR